MESATNATCELDVCLAKCTNPLSEISDDLIAQLCRLSSELPNGPFTTLRFLAYKAQSPQECEAIHALQILERVVKTGGFRIADEVGKFRFLNEIIKIVSPKYLAHRTSVRVRQRIVELIFIWSMEFKELPKIFEAYQMLKVQKIVTEDPVHVLENFRPPTPPEPRPKDEIFDNENTVQTLKTLLDSGRPDQLQTANRLIKNLAMKAESRMQFRATFNTELESIQNCAQLLFDMLAQCNLNLRIDPIQKLILDKGSSDEEFQLMRELFANCEKSRMKLFKFANQINSTNKDDTQESDDLNRLLSVAELLTSAINSCKRYFALLNNPRLAAISTAIIVPTSTNNNGGGGGDLSSIAEVSTAVNSEERLLDLNSVLPPITGLDLDPSNSIPDPKEATSDGGNTNDQVIDLMMMIGNHQSDTNGLVSDVTTTNEPAKFKSAVDELNALSDMMIKQHLSQSSESNGTVSNASNASSTNTQTTRCLSLNQLQQQQQLWQKFAHTSNESDGPSQDDQPDSTTTTTNSSPSPLNLSELLSNCFVSYDSIVPCTTAERQIPLLLFNENGLMITLHFTGNRPHPQILVLLLTFSNYNPVPVSKIQFLAAVPKNMKVKLQPQTGTSLPGLSTKSSPTGTNLPSIFITQLLLVAFNEPNAPGACPLPDQTVSSACSFSSQYTSLSSSQSSLSSSPDLAASTTTTTDSKDSSFQNNGYSNQNFSNKKFRLKFKFSYQLNNDIPYEHVSYFDCNLF